MEKMKILATALIVALLTACGGGGSSTPASMPVVDTPPGTPAPAKTFDVLSANVANGASGIDPGAPLKLVFTLPLGAAGLGPGQLALAAGVQSVPVRVDVAGSAVTVTPVSRLALHTDYRLTVKSGVAAADGTALKTDYVLAFRTEFARYEPRPATPADRSVIGSNMPRIKIADVNGDGRDDLIELASLYRPDLFAPNGYVLNIYLQNAAGGFDRSQKLEYIADQSAYNKNFNNLIVLDIDGDHKPELLVPEFRGDDEATAGIRVFRTGADGKYAAQEFIATNYSESLDVFDVDGDGKPDLVGSNRRAIDQVTGGFQVLRGTATGFVKMAPVRLPGGGYSFAIADLDQDGKPELIVNRLFARSTASPITTELLIHSQGPAGAFALNAALTGEAAGLCSAVAYCEDMMVADLDRDGRPELVFDGYAPGFQGGRLLLAFSRKAGGGFATSLQLPISGASLRGIRDMDGDGFLDVLVAGQVIDMGTYFNVLAGGPNFSFTYPGPTFVTADQTEPHTIAIGDGNADGKPDVVFDTYNYGIIIARRVN